MAITMLELKQIETREFFAKMKTIQQLQDMSHPRLNYGTIVNAINRGKLVSMKFGGHIEGQGIWIISLDSARNLWPDRFKGGN